MKWRVGPIPISLPHVRVFLRQGLNGNPSRVERLTHGIDMKLSIVRLAVLASAAL